MQSKFIGFALLGLAVLVMFSFPAFFSGFIMFAAIVPAGLVGNLQGKVGNFVFAKWKSIKTLRAYQPQVRQNETPALLAQRLRFSLIQHVASVAINFIKSGYRNFATEMSQYNYFISQNIGSAITGAYPNLSRDYTKLKFSAGTLLGLSGYSITGYSVADCSIGWSDNQGEANALATDVVSCLVVCEGSELTGIVKSFGGDQRVDEEITTTLPQHFIGKTAHFYATVVSLDGQLVSDSQYVGSHVITA